MKSPEPFETLDPENWDEMSELAHRMVDDVLSHFQSVRERPAWQPVPADVAERLNAVAPQEPLGASAVYEEFRRDVLPFAMNTSHPRFWAWYMGSGTVLGALADLLAATLNPNLGGGNHAAPLVESQVIAWIREMVGFPAQASGLLTSGASMANFTALTVARNTACGYDVRREGVRAAPGPLTAYASTEIHSCNQKAVETLGLGSDGLRRIPVADFCAREGLWFHVDGAIGAVAVLADNVRDQLAGMARADSIALDLHKWMHIPFEAGCVLVRDAAAHRDSFALVPEYLQREEGGRGMASGSMWFSDYGLQLTRQFRALKVWMSIKEHGLLRFGRMIARNVEQARYLGQLVEQTDNLELVAPIGLDIVCFRYNPGGLDDEALDRLNQDLLVELQESGVAAPSYTTLHGRYCLRVAISNHRSRFEDFDALIEAVLGFGDQLR
jgi:glutamate/tyrosine decarboxylase-like PLP-dependent enzyme